MSPGERMARIALACAVEPGTAGVAEAVEELGAPVVLRQVVRAGAANPAEVVGRLEPDQVPGMLERMEHEGVRVLVAGDAEYPSQLQDLAEPPLALWVRGPLDLRTTALRSAAVVGARACTAYGERVTADLAAGLAEQGWAVVSGGAFGIDAAAHRAALGVGGPTVAVLACGVDVAYPRAHDALLCRIADTGLVISELPPGSPTLRHRFLARNRLIAALTAGTVVVEAALRSGAMATANRAHEVGRVVMAVPGPVTSMASGGTNRMLHEQSARAVVDAEQVVALLAGPAAMQLGLAVEAEAAPEALPAGAALGSPGAADTLAEQANGPAVLARGAGRRRSRRSAGFPTGLPEDAMAVFAEVPARTARGTGAIAARSGMTSAQCLAHLGLRELAGRDALTPGWRRTG